MMAVMPESVNDDNQAYEKSGNWESEIGCLSIPYVAHVHRCTGTICPRLPGLEEASEVRTFHTAPRSTLFDLTADNIQSYLSA